MKKITVIALLLAAALGAQARNGSGKPAYKDASRPVEERVSDLLSRMTLEEKVMQLNQYTLGRNDNANNVADPVDKIPAEIGSLIYFDTSPGLRNRLQKKAIEQSRLGIPVLFGYDVIHGFRTTYPISLAQACSWNPALVKQAAEVAAQEARMSGVEWTFSPMIDVARDGRWGRVSEGYGEDPYANAVYGVAAVEGYQGDNLADSRRVAACLKHFVGYGASEAGRDYVYTEISRQTLWDTYIPPYQAGIEAGAATVMSCFNDISGTPGTANPYILTEVLKERWAHDGFVVSDWAAIEQLRSQGVAADRKEAAEKAFNAGCRNGHDEPLLRRPSGRPGPRRQGLAGETRRGRAARSAAEIPARAVRTPLHPGVGGDGPVPASREPRRRRAARRGVDGAAEKREQHAAAESRPPHRGHRPDGAEPAAPARRVVGTRPRRGRGEPLRRAGKRIPGPRRTALRPGLRLRRRGLLRIP